MKPKAFKEATQAVPEMPAQPEPEKLGNSGRLLQRIRTQSPDLLTRQNFVLLHERTCVSATGAPCSCDVRACVDGSTLRLRD